ncbi:MAG: alginate lyase family protein [Ignavibacteriales bacterium]|nr:alginate lyase family protein [Ignavibacteriales bacterium]
MINSFWKVISITAFAALVIFGCKKSASTSSTNTDTNKTVPPTYNLRHPGIFNSQADLDFIKSTVNAGGSHPLVAGYQILANDGRGSLSFTPTPFAIVDGVPSGSSPSEDAYRDDAHAAYIHTIKWVVTGNPAYKDKAIQIYNAWSYTFTGLVVYSNNQQTLESSWALPIWIAGAEIIRFYNNGAAGWSADDVGQFLSFVDKQYHTVLGPSASAPNWHISQALSIMATGVFFDSVAIYNTGYTRMQNQIDEISANGDVPELTRDFEHSQYCLIGMAQGAEIAHQQGDDGLWTRTNGTSSPRLLLCSESYVKCLMGTGTPNYQSSSGSQRHSAPYEIILTRYSDLGMAAPQTRTYVLTQNRPENCSQNHFVGWLSATHANVQ